MGVQYTLKDIWNNLSLDEQLDIVYQIPMSLPQGITQTVISHVYKDIVFFSLSTPLVGGWVVWYPLKDVLRKLKDKDLIGSALPSLIGRL